MGMAVLLFASPDDVALDGEAAARLVAIGVTHATVVRDESTVAVVLEGWRFDAGRSGPQAAEAVGGPIGAYRVLRQLRDTSVLPEAWPSLRAPQRGPRSGGGGKEEA
ncbi:MAG: hypothetical protein ACRDIW_03095 [Actinomycetota bacterium]